MIPLDDTTSGGRFPFWTLLIIAINIYVFYLEITSGITETFIMQYALIPAAIDLSNPESLLPFITSQFLHGGFLHLLSNMWFLWIFGDNVEGRMGSLFFPLFYLGAGIAGSFLQLIFMPDSTIPMLGASGAIAGVLGAYFAWFPYHKIKTLVPIFGLPAIINIPASLMLFYWFFIQLLSGAFSLSVIEPGGGVAWFAHVGGFAYGWLIAKAFSKPQQIAY